jgi:hypothetical protein
MFRIENSTVVIGVVGVAVVVAVYLLKDKFKKTPVMYAAMCYFSVTVHSYALHYVI